MPVINLETSVTRSADFAPGKAGHYRMSPDNLPCVAVARPDVLHRLPIGEFPLLRPARAVRTHLNEASADAAGPLPAAIVQTSNCRRPKTVADPRCLGGQKLPPGR